MPFVGNCVTCSVQWRIALRGSRLLALLALLSTVAVAVSAAGAAAAEAVVGDLRAVLNPYDGITPATGVRVFHRGVPFITRSSINVVSPDWKQAHFALSRCASRPVVETVPGGKRLRVTTEDAAARVDYAVELAEVGRVVLDLRVTFRGPGPAILEYAAGYLYAAPLGGQPYRAVTAEGERAGTMPFSPVAAEPRAAMVVPPLRRLEIDTRLGTLTVALDPPSPGLDLFDARKIPSPWLQENPVFWLGHLSIPLESGQEYHSRVTLEIRPQPDRSRPERLAPPVDSLALRAVPDVRLPWQPDGEIIPRPREWRKGPDTFVVTPGTRILIGRGAAARRAARELQQRLQDDFGLRIPTAPAGVWPDTRGAILLGLARDPVARHWASGVGLTPVRRREGYALRIGRSGGGVIGADARGLLYGVFALLQLACRSAGDGPDRGAATAVGSVWFQAATIRDWPAIPTRGVHLLTDHWSAFLHRDLIRHVLAPHRINTILLECEYVKWESHPEIHVPWGMSKADVQALLALARDYYIEVIPLVRTLGHVRWMFENGQHLDLAEDPRVLHAYCPSNPKVYDLVFDVFREAIEFFGRPRYFHIGHDEFNRRGQFGQHEPCRGKDVGHLFLSDTVRLRDFLAQRGARTMMWGDMILGPGEAGDAAHAATREEARRLRERLPKDILITDWHYAPAPEYPSLRILRDAGFEVWAATWYQPENIRGFAQAAAREASGLIQTTWTGYSGNMTAPRNWFPQLWAYVSAAACGWAPEALSVEELARVASRRFASAWPALPRGGVCARGFTVDMGPLATLPWEDTPERTGWLGYGPQHDLRALPFGSQRLGVHRFELPTTRRAVGLAGLLLPFRYAPSVEVPIGRPAGELVFLMATGWETAEGAPVGQIRLQYGDGGKLDVGLLYGWNIRAASDGRTALLAPVAWEGKTGGSDTVRLRAFALRNPFPRRAIASVTITSRGTEAAPVVFAISGLD